MEVRELSSDAEIAAAYALMRELRDRIPLETFGGEFRRPQANGYRLYGGFDSGRLVALAGVRRAHTLSRGEHFFVDDLVTAEGIPRVYLDSRATARGFYERAGFTFLTAVPCWIETSALG